MQIQWPCAEVSYLHMTQVLPNLPAYAHLRHLWYSSAENYQYFSPMKAVNIYSSVTHLAYTIPLWSIKEDSRCNKISKFYKFYDSMDSPNYYTWLMYIYRSIYILPDNTIYATHKPPYILPRIFQCSHRKKCQNSKRRPHQSKGWKIPMDSSIYASD